MGMNAACICMHACCTLFLFFSGVVVFRLVWWLLLSCDWPEFGSMLNASHFD